MPEMKIHEIKMPEIRMPELGVNPEAVKILDEGSLSAITGMLSVARPIANDCKVAKPAVAIAPAVAKLITEEKADQPKGALLDLSGILDQVPKGEAPSEQESDTALPPEVQDILKGRADEEGVTEQDVNPDELAMGIELEQEHTGDEAVAKKIAMDHLAEIPDYYTRLKAMEQEAKEELADQDKGKDQDDDQDEDEDDDKDEPKGKRKGKIPPQFLKGKKGAPDQFKKQDKNEAIEEEQEFPVTKAFLANQLSALVFRKQAVIRLVDFLQWEIKYIL
jgi:hypothetical protein